MKANPGGNLDPDCVYGRENLINILWERLESQSILINAERRIGKTQILRKMQIQPQPGWKPLFKVLERIHSAQEFAELVYDDVQQFLGSTTRAKNFIQKVLEDNETDYIHHVVAGLRLEQTIATPASIRRHIESQLVNAADPWQLTHYRTRLPTYYPNPDDTRKVTAILDALATNSTPENPLSINQLLQLAPPHINGQHDREDLLRLLRLMDADHYISRNTSGGFHFRFPLIQRWWKLERGL